jgi:hypothetical protein
MAGPGSHIDLFLFPARSNLAILNKTAGIRALFGKQQHMDCSQETQTYCMHGLSSKILVNQDNFDLEKSCSIFLSMFVKTCAQSRQCTFGIMKQLPYGIILLNHVDVVC